MPARVRSPSPSSSHQSSPRQTFPETQFVQETDDSQNLWEAECILDERGKPVKGEYLIQWKGEDPSTGAVWEPTWEKKTGCTSDLIDEWKEKKRVDPEIVGRAGGEIEERIRAMRKRKKEGGSRGMKKRAKVEKKIVAAKVEKEDTRSKSPSTAPSALSAQMRPTRTRAPASQPPSAKLISTVLERPARAAGIQARDRLASHPKRTRSPSATTTNGGRRKIAEVEIPRRAKGKGKGRVSAHSEVADTDEVDEGVVAEDQEDAVEDLGDDAQGEERGGQKGAEDNSEWEGDAQMNQDGEEAVGDHQPAEEAAQAADEIEGGSTSGNPPVQAVDGTAEMNVAGQADRDRHLSPERPLRIITSIRTRVRQRKITIELSKDTTPSKARPIPNKYQSSSLLPVPQPSPSVYQRLPHNASQETHPTMTSQSNGISQMDPIGNFSSPARSTQVAATKALQQEQGEDDEESDEVIPATQPVKQVRRVIDGEEVITAEIESLEEEDDVDEAGGAEVHAGLDGQVDDGDLDDLAGLDEMDGVDGGIGDEDLANLDEPAAAAAQTNLLTIPQESVEVAKLREQLAQTTTDLQDRDEALADLAARLAESENSAALHREAAERRRVGLVGVRRIGMTASTPKEQEPRQQGTVETTKIEELEKRLMESRLAIQTLENQLSDVHKILDIRTASAMYYEAQLVQARKDLEDRSRAAVDLEGQVQNAQSDLESASTSKLSLVTQLEELRKDIAQLHLEIARKDLELTNLARVDTSDISALENQLTESRATVIALNTSAAKLQNDNAELSKSKDTLRGELSFIRQQYTQASDSAVSEINKSRALESQNATLREQLHLGLRQKSLHFDAIKAQLQEETTKLRMQNQFLLEQSRKTDDRVRQRAQKFLVMQKENKKWEGEIMEGERKVEELEKRVGELSRRNERLVGRYGQLLARQLGADRDGQGEGEASGSEYEGSETDTGSEESGDEEEGDIGDRSVFRGGSLGELGYMRRRASSEDHAEEGLLSPREGMEPEEEERGLGMFVEGLRCQHRTGSAGLCMVMTDDKQVLREHAISAHYFVGGRE